MPLNKSVWDFLNGKKKEKTRKHSKVRDKLYKAMWPRPWNNWEMRSSLTLLKSRQGGAGYPSSYPLPYIQAAEGHSMVLRGLAPAHLSRFILGHQFLHPLSSSLWECLLFILTSTLVHTSVSLLGLFPPLSPCLDQLLAKLDLLPPESFPRFSKPELDSPKARTLYSPLNFHGITVVFLFGFLCASSPTSRKLLKDGSIVLLPVVSQVTGTWVITQQVFPEVNIEWWKMSFERWLSRL